MGPLDSGHTVDTIEDPVGSKYSPEVFEPPHSLHLDSPAEYLKGRRPRPVTGNRENDSFLLTVKNHK